VENRRHKAVAILLSFLLLITIVQNVGTQSNLASTGSSGAKLTGLIYDDEGVDADSDGFFDYLKVGVQANVTEAGIYRASISGLYSSNSSYISVYEEQSMYLDVGLQVVNVWFYGPTIYLSGVNPVNISRIYLYDTHDNRLSEVYAVPLSREYSYTEFDAPGASLTGVIVDSGTDIDGDFLFDFLKVDVQANVTEPGIYSISLSGLRDANFSYIDVYGYTREYFDVGLQAFNLSLNGPIISASSFNPRFVDSMWLRDESYNIGSLSDIPLSREYLYTEFDAPPSPPSPASNASLTGVITDLGVDSDGDLRFDYLEVGIQINVTIANTYQIEVYSLRDAYWNYAYVWESESSYFDVGVHLLNVAIYGPTIRAYGFNLSYVSYMSLRDENGFSLDDLNSVPLSREYSYTEFDVPDAVLTGAVYDRGVDTDGDSTFNYLEVVVEINVTEPGDYQVGVSGLRDSELNYISVGDNVWRHFSDGTHTVNFSLNGAVIYSSNLNPRLVNYISLQDENYNYLGRLDDVLLSQEYLYNEFEHPTATLTDVIIDEGVDSDGDGSFDYLKIGVEVNVTEAGEYRVYVSGLRDAELNHINDYDSKLTYLDEGLKIVNVSLWGPTIYVSGRDPRLVSSINLQDENWNYLGSASNIPLSRKYLHTEFDAPGAHLTGVISDKGTDSDGDDLFNYLEVGVEVNVTEAGFYRVRVSHLEDVHLSEIYVSDYQRVYLIEGTHTINLTLNGLQIYTSDLNPAFISHIYLQDEDYRDIGSLNRITLSREYSYTEFDPPKAVLTGTIYDWGLDLDSDGTYDYLQIGVEINVSDSGNYHVEVSGLQDSSFNHIGVWDSASGYFDPGVHVLNVSLYGPTIHGLALNPMYISSVYLYDDYYSELNNVPLSQEYSYTDFDLPGAILTEVFSDYGVDTDGDGQFNYLTVEVEINVTEAGNYRIHMFGLLDSNHNSLDVYDYEWMYLDLGVQVVHFSVDGLRIHLAGFNPRYVDYVSLRDESDRYLSTLDDAWLSREYSYKEFEAPGAVFTNVIYDQGVDTDSDGFFNYLQVGVELNVTEAGTYEVSVEGLRDTYGNWIGVYGYVREYLEDGIQVLNVSLSGLTIYLSEHDPKYINYVSLIDQNYNELDKLSDVPLSREYSHEELDPPGAVLTGVIFDQGIDTDSDGTYDYLQIGVQVNVTDPGNYYVHIDNLLDSNFDYINVYDSNFTFLDVGLQTVYLHLEGPRIYLSYRNPRYIDYVGLRDEYYTYYDSLSLIPLSREYSYAEFDPPTAMLTGRIYDRGVDTDGDGAFNYLEIGVEINVTKSGVYRVYVSELRDAFGNWIGVWSDESDYLDVGIGVLNVSLYGPTIYSSRRNPMYVCYINLYADYSSYLQDIPLSREYLYSEFDFPAILTGVIFDQGVDTDADGSFDYLEVGVQVNVSDSGTYILAVSGLRDASSYYVGVWDSKTIYLNTGIQTVNLYLYGPQIYATRRNPTMISYISLTESQYTYYYNYYYDTLHDVPLSREYSYTEFDSPLMDVKTKFTVYPDGRVAVEGVLNYTNMVPENRPRHTTAQGFFNLTGDGQSSHASAGLSINLPTEIASQFPFNSTAAEVNAEYSNGLLDLGINSTMFLPPLAESLYPYNATDGTITANYSGGILNIEVEGNTTLPALASNEFPFNSTDIAAVGTYSSNTLDGRITFSVLDDFTFDDVNVDFAGNQTDLTLNGTIHVAFNIPWNDFIVRNETDLIEKIDQLRSELPHQVSNLTGGILNVTDLNIDYVLNGIGASVTFRINVHGDFIRGLAYVLSGGRNEMLLYPVLNEAYESVQEGYFDIQYSHDTSTASLKLAFSYDLTRFIDYVLTPPTETSPYIMTSNSMSPTLWMGDVVMVEKVSNASDIVADPETGDIIAFYHPHSLPPYDQRYVVFHRAINKTYVNGTLYFTTKGDAYWPPDSWSVPEDNVIGRAVRRIPLLGYLVSYPYLYYPYYYYYPYSQNTTEASLSLLKAACNSVENMSVQLSYSSIDRRFDFKMTAVDKLKALIEESVLILPEMLPPETPSEIRSFVESLLNTTYASVNSANVSFIYESGKADFEATVAVDGDLSAEVNYMKDLYFQLMGAQYRRYNVTVPEQLDFINQTKVDVNNFKIGAKLGETSLEGKIEGLTLTPPTDVLNATHFKLENLFNLTAPQYSWQQEFPGQDQKLTVTIEGGSNGTHSVRILRPSTVPEPDSTTPEGKLMVWFNQTLSGLKDLIFEIETKSYVGVHTDKPVYTREETVNVTASYVFEDEAVENATVRFQVDYPNGTLYNAWTENTTANGIATFEFSLGTDVPLGNYTIFASAYKAGYPNATATTKFLVAYFETELEMWLEGPDISLLDQHAIIILHVVNVGNATAENVNITFNIPEDVTVVSANTSFTGSVLSGEEVILLANVTGDRPNRYVFNANATYTTINGTRSVSAEKVLIYAYHVDYPVDWLSMTMSADQHTIVVNITVINYGDSSVEVTLIASAQHIASKFMLKSAYQTVVINPGETITISLTMDIPAIAPSGEYMVQGILSTGLPREGGFTLTYEEQTIIV